VGEFSEHSGQILEEYPMKTLSIAFLCLVVLGFSAIAGADQLTQRCSGISTNNAKVVVLIYRGQNAVQAGGDALVIVSETNKGRRVFTSRVSGRTQESQILTSGNNSGLKLTMHQVGVGYLWLGDGHESFGLTCQTM
jgi:hypothetical protein